MRGLRAVLGGERAVIHAQITGLRGSSPRELGAEMFVTAQEIAGTIGGGQAEWQSLGRAREMLAHGEMQARLEIALGPEIGQCCGGRITVTLTRLGASARATALARIEAATPHVVILGAGHVGRALAEIMAPLPCRVLLVDPRAAELARATPLVETRLTPLPEAEIAAGPPGSAYVVATHDHGLDFLLTLAALRRGDAAYIGLIGSATKRRRFEAFARETQESVDTSALICPMAPQAGSKHPGVIALATAQEILDAFATAREVAPIAEAQ